MDCDDNSNRWMIVRVSLNALYQYLNKEKALLQVIEDSSDNFVWIADLDGKGEQINTLAVPFANLPEDYLPDTDSYFEFDNQQELLKDVDTDKIEVDIPKKDKSFFAALISKMGWRLSSDAVHNLIDRIAF